MSNLFAWPTEWAILLLALAVALPFKPWQVLKHRPLQNPWLATLVMLPWFWWLQQLLPSGVAFRLGGACLMVLMFGWPLAIWSLPIIAGACAVIEVFGPIQWHWQKVSAGAQALAASPNLDTVIQHWLALVPAMTWTGVIPATLALGIGMLMRRWLPLHVFVYILGRGFIATVLAVSLTGVLSWQAGLVPQTMDTQEWLLGHWLLAWGEAISTGMLVAIFVAFKPQWLLTYSDERYLPPPPPPTTGDNSSP